MDEFDFKDLFASCALGRFGQLGEIFGLEPTSDSSKQGGHCFDKGGVFSFKDFDSSLEETPQQSSPLKRVDAKKELESIEPRLSFKRCAALSPMPPHEDAPKSKLMKRETNLMSTPQVKAKPRLFTSERRTVPTKPQTPKFTATAEATSVRPDYKPPVEVNDALYGEELRRLAELRLQIEQISSEPQAAAFLHKCTRARGHYLAAELKIAQTQARILGLTNRILALRDPDLELTLSELLRDN